MAIPPVNEFLVGASGRGVVIASDVQSWNTPRVILVALKPLGPIGLDPCSNATSIVRARTKSNPPRAPMSAADAMNLAVWLLVLASLEDGAPTKEDFDAAVKAALES